MIVQRLDETEYSKWECQSDKTIGFKINMDTLYEALSIGEVVGVLIEIEERGKMDGNQNI